MGLDLNTGWVADLPYSSNKFVPATAQFLFIFESI